MTELTDEQVFGPGVKFGPVARGRELTDAEVFGGAKETPPEPEKWDVVRGAVSSFRQEQPELLGKTLEGLSHLVPEGMAGPFRSGGTALQKYAASPRDPAYVKKSKGIGDIANLADLDMWMGENLGSGLASSTAPLVLGGLGAWGGTAVGGVPGGIAGGLAGGVVGGIGLNYGEAYKAFQEAQIPDADAAKYAAYIAPVLAGLDAAGLALPILRSMGIFTTVKQAVVKDTARRAALKAVTFGATSEGATEASQEATIKATISAATGVPFATIENLKAIGEAGAAGALPGAFFGGGTHGTAKPKPEQDYTEQTPEIRRAIIEAQTLAAASGRGPLTPEEMETISRSVALGGAQPPIGPGPTGPAGPAAGPAPPAGPAGPAGPTAPVESPDDMVEVPGTSGLPRVKRSLLPEILSAMARGGAATGGGAAAVTAPTPPTAVPPPGIPTPAELDEQLGKDIPKTSVVPPAPTAPLPGVPSAPTESFEEEIARLLAGMPKETLPGVPLAGRQPGTLPPNYVQIPEDEETVAGAPTLPATPTGPVSTTAPLEGEIIPPDKPLVIGPGTLDPEIQDFVNRATARLTLPTGKLPLSALIRKRAGGTGSAGGGALPDRSLMQRVEPDEPMHAGRTSVNGPGTPVVSMQGAVTTTEAQAGVDMGSFLELLKSKLYGSPKHIAPVTVKETLQNSFDAIKGAQEKGKITKGKISIKMDGKKRTISTLDNGLGMDKDTLATTFIQAGASKKETARPSGGFGIAKLLYLLENKTIRVITMRDGKVSRLTSTGPEIQKAMESSGKTGAVKLGNIVTNAPTNADWAMFPEGHGTFIEVTVPDSFIEPNTKKVTPIPFDASRYYHPALLKSPLFADIDVTFEGMLGRESIDTGAKFPAQEYTRYDAVDFPAWGEAIIYATKAEKKVENHHQNVHVLSNGIWQFSMGLPTDPMQPSGKKIQREFFVDIATAPGITPKSDGYPFDLNRQGFTETATEDFTVLFHYLIKTFELHDYNMDVDNFGNLQFLTFNERTGKVEVSLTKELKPPTKGRNRGPAGNIDPHAKMVVKNGQLKVAGKTVKNLSIKDISKFAVDTTSLKLPLGTVPLNSLILHENTLVDQPKVVGGAPGVQTSLPGKGVVQMAVDKFGPAVYDYAFAMADAMQELRDVVARVMPNKQYAKLTEEVVGVSVDPGYHGVSIRLPFNAALLNIFLTRGGPGMGEAMNMIFTMLHEFAHHIHRSELDLAPYVQDMAAQLWIAATPKPGSNVAPFDFQAFAQRIVNIFGTYREIIDYTNGVYKSGLVRPRGKSFTVSPDTGGVGRSLGSPGNPNLATRDGRKLSDWVEAGKGDISPDTGHPADHPTLADSGGESSFGKDANQRAHNAEDPGQSAVQQSAEFAPARQAIATVLGGQANVPTPIKQMAAHADRMNWWYKWWMGLDQLVNQFPTFEPLLRYYERVVLMHNEEAQIQDTALRISKEWRSLGAQAENLSAYLDDLANMVYRSPREIAQGVSRNPTPAEATALERTHKLSPRAILVRNKIVGVPGDPNSNGGMFGVFLDMTAQNAVDTAVRLIQDPVARTNRIVEIMNQAKAYKSRPYFPFTRFGRHFVTVRDSAGKVVHFDTFERQGLKSAESLQQAYKKKMEGISANTNQGWNVTDGILPETAEPFLGMSSFMLDAIGSDLTLTPLQRDALEQLQYQYSPAASFRHYFQHKNYVPGYSMDFQRSFARYFFHGAKYYSRTKHAWALEGLTVDARAKGGNFASKIADYMDDHMRNTVLDAKSDIGAIKGAMFMWAMAYVPAAAFQNLSQTPMITYPFLWAKFGSLKAGRAMSDAMTDVTNFYKKGSYTGSTDFKMRALDYGIKTGRISETQAADLAGLAQGAGLLYGLGGTVAQQQAIWVQEKGAWMFETAEQINRRIAFRAGLRLGLENPNKKFVKDSIAKSQAEYDAIVISPKNPHGFTPAEAAAVVTAINVVDQTQYVYARYARARFMRGRLTGTIFVFQKYLQSTLTMLSQNKSDVLPRFMLVAFFLGGLAAWPGWDDLKEIVKGVGRWKFGKHWDLDKEVRDYILQFGNGKVPPDLILHGLARYGYGVPAILDAMGSLFTGRPGRGFDPAQQQATNIPFPVFDRSRAISMGHIMNLELGKLIPPSRDVNSTIADQVQKASGAVFSVGFNMYKALADNHLEKSDPKRWERAVPRLLASASKAFRAFNEGRERSGLRMPGSASTVVTYDRRDTEQMMEIIGIAAGYRPLREAGRWDHIMADMEVTKFHEMRRQGLMENHFEALRGKIPQERDRTLQEIKDYNNSIKGTPYAGNVIDGRALVQSMENRAMDLAKKERNLPTRLRDVPVRREMDRLYPEGVPRGLLEQRQIR